jgi:hypothetical protein
MRPSLTEIKQTGQYLCREMNPQDAAVFQALLLTDPILSVNTHYLEKVFSLLRLYHRKKLKEEAIAMHNKLFTDPCMADFQQKIWQLFNT